MYYIYSHPVLLHGDSTIFPRRQYVGNAKSETANTTALNKKQLVELLSICLFANS